MNLRTLLTNFFRQHLQSNEPPKAPQATAPVSVVVVENTDIVSIVDHKNPLEPLRAEHQPGHGKGDGWEDLQHDAALFGNSYYIHPRFGIIRRPDLDIKALAAHLRKQYPGVYAP
jgi:hypothetical protein